jgi:hypothetical protein
MIKLKCRWIGHVTCVDDIRNSFKSLVRKSEQKRLLGRSRHRWEGEGKSGPKETVWKDMCWIKLTRNRDH